MASVIYIKEVYYSYPAAFTGSLFHAHCIRLPHYNISPCRFIITEHRFINNIILDAHALKTKPLHISTHRFEFNKTIELLKSPNIIQNKMKASTYSHTLQ